MKIGLGLGILNTIIRTLLVKINFFRNYYFNKIGLKNNNIKNEDRFIELFALIKYKGEGIAKLTFREMYNIYIWVIKTEHLEGDMAEVGVYKGGSAKIILQASSGKRKLHLFDTFSGMPEYIPEIDGVHGTFTDTSIEEVKNFLKGYKNVIFHVGKFPDSLTFDLDDKIYSFVHIDVDLYKSTLDCLNYFYPRLCKGGVLISHDYNSINCPGVKKAFNEFFSDKTEQVIELWDSQCMIIKQ